MSNKVLVAIIIALCAVIGILIGIQQISSEKNFSFFDKFSQVFSSSNNSTKTEIENPESNTETSNDSTPLPVDIPNQSDDLNEITIPESQTSNVRAVYASGWSIGTKGVRESIIKNMQDNNFNAIVIDIKDESGQLSYDSSVQTAIDIEASKKMIGNISSIIEELHANNIYVIGRIVTFKDNTLASNPQTVVAFRQEDGSVWKDYNQNQWPNPYNKNSWEYPISLAIEAASLGFDEIQFDYVRFPSTEGKTSTIAYGFDSDKKSKSDIICDFLVEAVTKLRPYGVKVSATAIGTSTKKEGDFQNIGQDFTRMTAIVDVIYPIIYPSDYAEYDYKIAKPDLNPYDIVYNALKDAKSLVNDTNKIRPYLQDFAATWLGEGYYSPNTADYVTNELQAAYDNQIQSFVLWNSSNRYHYSALSKVNEE